jgi:hypothetical protein
MHLKIRYKSTINSDAKNNFKLIPFKDKRNIRYYYDPVPFTIVLIVLKNSTKSNLFDQLSI